MSPEAKLGFPDPVLSALKTLLEIARNLGELSQFRAIRCSLEPALHQSAV